MPSVYSSAAQKGIPVPNPKPFLEELVQTGSNIRVFSQDTNEQGRTVPPVSERSIKVAAEQFDEQTMVHIAPKDQTHRLTYFLPHAGQATLTGDGRSTTVCVADRIYNFYHTPADIPQQTKSFLDQHGTDYLLSDFFGINY